jgi:predicted O-linked N-acetylglucosamine transferase (SPINDLY family)
MRTFPSGKSQDDRVRSRAVNEAAAMVAARAPEGDPMPEDVAVLNLGGLFGAAQPLPPEHAAALYRAWLARNADDPLAHAAWFNYGVVLSSAGDLAGAAAAFQAAIQRNAAFLPPFINLGIVYERAGATEAALAHWNHVAAQLGAVSAEGIGWKVAALKHVARVLEGQRQHAAAEAALGNIIGIAPETRDVVQHWVALRQRQCIWPLFAPVGALDRATLLARSAPLSVIAHTDDPLLALAVGAATSAHEAPMPRHFRTSADFAARRGGAARRLRIGYLSSDLRSHAIGHLTADLFRHHDRARVEVFGYYTGIPQEDAVKARIRADMDHWVDIAALDDDAAVALVLRDGIDILVDVNGHTRGSRPGLLARRPAPVIVNWLGYPGSMGSAHHHYILADAIIIPPGSEHFYSEEVRRLPCYQPNDRHRDVAAPPTREAMGLPDGAVVFACFNGAQKITPFGFARFLRVLAGVPGSVLWLLKSSEAVDATLRARAREAGIDPARLIFAPMAANAAHVARYACADLFLDTAPYGAHTTASDALWMGTPVLTWPGRGFASRVCASLVTAAGVPELIVDSPDDYVAEAIALGRDPGRLRALRARLLASRPNSLLFDTDRFCRALEDCYDTMWRAFEEDRLPRPNLTNLPTYLEIGAARDHDAVEWATVADDAAQWQAALARRHAFSPLPADGRCWGAA